jgi:hypothetical protein
MRGHFWVWQLFRSESTPEPGFQPYWVALVCNRPWRSVFKSKIFLMGETPIWEIQKAALKDSQADDRQGIDCHEKGQRPFQPIFPLSPKSSLAGWLDELSARLQPRHAGPSGISSVQTRKLERVLGPNVVVIATSAASRPRASNTLPIRGTLLRASNVYHCPPR